MVKRVMLVLVLLAFMALVATPAMAAEATPVGGEAWFNERFEAKKAQTNQLLQEGKLTLEQAEFRLNNMARMYEFHAQNGYICPANGPVMMKQGVGRGVGEEPRMLGPGNGKGFGGGKFGR